MRVVFDTNVLISVLLFGGEIDKIYDLITDGRCIPCFTASTLAEFKEVVGRDKFKNALQRRGYGPDDVVKIVQNEGLFSFEQKISPVIHQDPEDDKFLACALASQASFIVSGDRHLLELGAYENILIITPREFLRKIKA